VFTIIHGERHLCPHSNGRHPCGLISQRAHANRSGGNAVGSRRGAAVRTRASVQPFNKPQSKNDRTPLISHIFAKCETGKMSQGAGAARNPAGDVRFRGDRLRSGGGACRREASAGAGYFRFGIAAQP
jgi:hypothetical protein